MTRYWLREGDCLEIMKKVKDYSIHAVITDLPYGTTQCKWDAIIPLDLMWKEAKRILKPKGVFITTASQPFTTILISSNFKAFKYEWIWVKTMPTGLAQSSYMPMKYHENIVVFIESGKPVFNKQMAERSESGKVRAKTPIQSSVDKGSHQQLTPLGAVQYDPDKINPKSVLEFGSVANSNNKKLHPTQKPVALYEYLIKTYTNENDIVADICMGSGTTGVAALNLNRRLLGIEKDSTYFEIAKNRIEETERKLNESNQ